MTAALSAREAYRLWAPRYAAETVISALDEQLAQALSPSANGKRLLDAGCGTGRRLPRDAGLAVGVDASPEMLAAGGVARVAAADIRALPFAEAQFDLIWCRLVLGHLADPWRAYRELARVCRPGGALLVSDFHPAAVAHGHGRGFRDEAGRTHTVEHHVHDAPAHIRMAAQADFVAERQCDGEIDQSVEPLYRAAGRIAAYEKDRGLAVVAAFLFRRADRCAC